MKSVKKLIAMLLSGLLMVGIVSFAENTTVYAEEEKTFKVLVINFDPIFPDAYNKRQHELMDWWNDPHQLADDFIADMKEISYDYANYQIIEWLDLNEMPRSEDGKAYDLTEYYNTLVAANKDTGGAYWNDSRWHDWGFTFDYDFYFSKYDVYKRIDNGEIDEVWIFTGPMVGVTLYETRMVGRNSYWCNSPGLEKECRPFVVYGFNYEREVAEMLHDAGHRAEFILDEVFGWPDYTKDYDQFTDWEKFSVYDIQKPGMSGPGAVHFAPNSESDYDWSNSRLVDSYALDWQNYPNMTGEKQKINCTVWNGEQRQYLKWWFSLIPHAYGINHDSGKYNNWWIYFTLDYINDPPTALTGASQWAKTELLNAINEGVVPETMGENGWKKPISRLDAAKAMVLLIEKTTKKDMIQIAADNGWDLNQNCFDDTNDPSVTFLRYSEITAGVGNNLYAPDSFYTRAQMVTMIGRIAARFFDVDLSGQHSFRDVPDWATPYVGFAVKSGITKGIGEGLFGSENVLDYQQTAVFSYRSYLSLR